MSDEQTYIDEDGRTVHRTEYPHIVKVDGLRGGRAVVEGTGLEVWILVGYFYGAGMTVDEIVADFDHLSHAAVYSVLAYYQDHRAEIDHERYVNSYAYWQEQNPETANNPNRSGYVHV